MSDEATDLRLQQATSWAQQVLAEDQLRVTPISADASFRRYFRLYRDRGAPLVLMDAPPEREDSRPFLDIARRLRDAGLHAPQVLHFDLEHGFGIIEDLGNALYREVIDARSHAEHFSALFDVLERMAREVPAEGLPPYDDALLQKELDLFPNWYLEKHKKRPFSDAEHATWSAVCNRLLENAGQQPQVFVHRDFHSCNLMYRKGDAPGIIDFQDAVHGPLSYDFISLIWDRYIHWPRSQLEQWMTDMHRRLEPGVGLEAWIRHCDLMGLQRNLKVVGIFARLRYRDGRQGYVGMIPMFYRYLVDVLTRYPEFGAFAAILEDESCAP